MAVKTHTPADTKLASQWHLYEIGRLGFGETASISGLARVWSEFTGAGINVGIWDDGVQKSHWDLTANYNASLQVSVNSTLNNGQPIGSESGHGTSVAGLIAAAANGKGGVGIAYGASVTGVRIFGGADDINDNWARYLKTLDNLSKFDVTNHSYGGDADFILYPDTAKFLKSLETGRGGLGTINVKSAGNDDQDGNGESVDASRATITVAAVDRDGNVADYSNQGAHILVSGSAAEVTTDLTGTAGYNSSRASALGNDMTDDFGGTSAAAPVVSAVATLMLDANAALGWRDVQEILVYSAFGTGSIISGESVDTEDGEWFYNDAKNWNGGGLHFSTDYGFGLVNAHAAVRMAQVWSLMNTTAATSANEVEIDDSAGSGQIETGGDNGQQIGQGRTTDFTFTVTNDIELEHVDLTLNLVHDNMRNMIITVIAPSGSSVVIYDGSPTNIDSADFGLNNASGYAFGIDAFRGESSAGTWTVRVEDSGGSTEKGKMYAIDFAGFGSTHASADVYHYTEEVFATYSRDLGTNRRTLTDSDGGTDWLNLAAMVRDLVVDLNAGESSYLDDTEFLTIAAGTLIENVACGDGDDTIVGNALNNIIAGMRGDDVIDGGDGVDTACYFGSRTSYTVIYNGVVVEVRSIDGTYGTDLLTAIETLRFGSTNVSLANTFTYQGYNWLGGTSSANTVRGSLAADRIEGGGGNDTLYGSSGSDYLIGGDGGDLMYGGVGNDTYSVTSSLDRVVEYKSQGFDTVETSLSKFTIGASVEAVRYTGSGSFAGTGNSLSNRMTGGAQADTLNGGSGSDTLDGGAGSDSMVGGTGNDQFYVDASGDVVVELASGGTDTVLTTLGTYTLGSQVEGLVKTDDGDFVGTGNSLANTITAGDGDDQLSGMSGNDTLQGGDGDDTLMGGTGTDRLTGGNGADVFVFATTAEVGTSSAPDVITDFVSGADLIDLSAIDADSSTVDDQAFVFVGSAAFGGTRAELRFAVSGSDILISGDINGDRVADFALRVSGISFVLADDFIL